MDPLLGTRPVARPASPGARARQALEVPGAAAFRTRPYVPRRAPVRLRAIVLTVTQEPEHVIACLTPGRVPSPAADTVLLVPTTGVRTAGAQPTLSVGPLPPPGSVPKVAEATAHREAADEVHRPVLGPVRLWPPRKAEVFVGFEASCCPGVPVLGGPIG